MIENKFYIVKKGDNLYNIANSLGVDLKKFMEFNKIKNPNRLQIGDTLRYDESVLNLPEGKVNKYESSYYENPKVNKKIVKTGKEIQMDLENDGWNFPYDNEYEVLRYGTTSKTPNISNTSNTISKKSNNSYKDSKYSYLTKDLVFDSRVNWDNVDAANRYLTEKLGPITSLAILSSAIKESYMDPNTVQNNGKGPGKGLLQWEDYPDQTNDRYDQMMKFKAIKEPGYEWIDPELKRQLDYIIHTTYDKVDTDSWKNGYGFTYAKDAQKKFINRNTPLSEKAKIFLFNYVRPSKLQEEHDHRVVNMLPKLDSLYNIKYNKYNE